MRIALSVGHSQKVRGMRGNPVPPECDEVDECLKICTDVSALLEAHGVECPMFFDTTSTSQSQYLANINNWTNQQNADLAVSCHLNAGGGDGPVGCEVWYYTQKTLAAKVSAAMAEALNLPDRSAKYSNSLSFLVNTNPPAILLECFFGDSRHDCEAYAENYAALVEAIAESMAGINLDDMPEEPPEPEQPPEVITEDNRVEVTSNVVGDVTVIVNGTLVKGHEGGEQLVDLTISLHGDVVLVINGENFHNKSPPEPEIQSNHRDIETTVFGGSGDPNYSAYDGDKFLNDSDLYVALPWKWRDTPRPKVKVFNRATGLSAIAEIWDVGPWNIDDDDYVLGDERPSAETHYETEQPLPTGPNAGKVPSNAAGLDLSPALARKVGIDGKGYCDWRFVDDRMV